MSTAAQRIGLWVLTNLGQPDEPEPWVVDLIIDCLTGSSVPEALATIGDVLAEQCS